MCMCTVCAAVIRINFNFPWFVHSLAVLPTTIFSSRRSAICIEWVHKMALQFTKWQMPLQQHKNRREQTNERTKERMGKSAYASSKSIKLSHNRRIDMDRVECSVCRFQNWCNNKRRESTKHTHKSKRQNTNCNTNTHTLVIFRMLIVLLSLVLRVYID